MSLDLANKEFEQRIISRQRVFFHLFGKSLSKSQIKSLSLRSQFHVKNSQLIIKSLFTTGSLFFKKFIYTSKESRLFLIDFTQIYFKFFGKIQFHQYIFYIYCYFIFLKKFLLFSIKK